MVNDTPTNWSNWQHQHQHQHQAPTPPPRRRSLLARILRGALAVFAVIVVAAIAAGVHGDTTPDSILVTPAVTGSASGDNPPPAAEAGSELPENVYRFGKTIRFDNGVTLAVGRPTAFHPQYPEFVSAGNRRHFVKFRVTLTNTTSEVLDPSLTTGAVTSGETEGESVYEDGLDAPDEKILPGKSRTWWMGYGVADPTRLTLTVSVGFLDGYPDVLFTNEI